MGMVLGVLMPKGNSSMGMGPMSGQMTNKKLQAIWNIIEKNYVDEIDYDTLMDQMYAAIFTNLDPHSSYLSAAEREKEGEELQGYFYGVGLVLRKRGDSVYVNQVVPGGPSDGVDVMACDMIESVDDTIVSGVDMNLDEVVKRIRGQQGSLVHLKLRRHGQQQPLELDIRRGQVEMNSVVYSGMIDDSTGYVRIKIFGESTYAEFCRAVSKLKDSKMKRLIIDLRDNSGGLMAAATGICDELLPGKEMIVYTEGAHSKRRELRSTPGGLFTEGKVLVMINEYSASASEIVAGAIQDNDRGIIVGRRSFGKGLVQQPFDLPDGSSVWLTTSRYYTPSGRCIQRPYSGGTDEYYSDFIEQVNNEYLQDSVFGQVIDSTPYYTSGGRVVYGGGGILPDYYINYKTSENVYYYNMLINKGVVDQYAFDIVVRDGKNIKKQFPTEYSFVHRYTVSGAMFEEMLRRGDAEGLKRDPACINKYHEEMKSYLKGLIGDMLYSDAAFYAIEIPHDPDLKEALQILNTQKAIHK